jgi:hypothetical protein
MYNFKTFGPVDVTVQFDDVVTAGPLVQTIYVLGDQGELRYAPLEFSQSQVARIRFGLGDQFPPPGVPLPNQLGIASEGLGSG